MVAAMLGMEMERVGGTDDLPNALTVPRSS
jgi:hypothetical protein